MNPSDAFLLTFVSLFPICNPFGNAAIFLSLTDGDDQAWRRSQALRASIWAFVLITAFYLAGAYIFGFFGISLPGVQTAGGLVILRIGFQQLTPDKRHHHSEEEENEAKSKKDLSFTPMALPLLSGPGSYAVVIALASKTALESLPAVGSVIAGIFAVTVTCWVCLREAGYLARILGINGMNALTRIMGFILLCIAVQLIIDGIEGVLTDYGLHATMSQGG